MLSAIRSRRQLKRHTFYLAGAMTGFQRFNYPYFDMVEIVLRSRGLTVLSPANWDFLDPLNPDELALGITHEHCVHQSMKVLSQCSAIILLPGWEQSSGAQAELTWSELHGLKVYRLEEILTEKQMQVLPQQIRKENIS